MNAQTRRILEQQGWLFAAKQDWGHYDILIDSRARRSADLDGHFSQDEATMWVQYVDSDGSHVTSIPTVKRDDRGSVYYTLLEWLRSTDWTAKILNAACVGDIAPNVGTVSTVFTQHADRKHVQPLPPAKVALNKGVIYVNVRRPRPP